MNKRIILVHGIHSHGDKSIDLLDEPLTDLGYEVQQYEYEKRWAIQLYSMQVQWQDARALRQFEYYRPGVHIVTHSYGGLIWQNAIKSNAKWGVSFLFAAAATSDKFQYKDLPIGQYPQEAFTALYNIYNPDDRALKWGARLPNHGFGKLGLSGYAGPEDDRIKNVTGFREGTGGNKHQYFAGEDAQKWAEYIDSHLR